LNFCSCSSETNFEKEALVLIFSAFGMGNAGFCSFSSRLSALTELTNKFAAFFAFFETVDMIAVGIASEWCVTGLEGRGTATEPAYLLELGPGPAVEVVVVVVVV
jgi:hypothetical protein